MDDIQQMSNNRPTRPKTKSHRTRSNIGKNNPRTSLNDDSNINNNNTNNMNVNNNFENDITSNMNNDAPENGNGNFERRCWTVLKIVGYLVLTALIIHNTMITEEKTTKILELVDRFKAIQDDNVKLGTKADTLHQELTKCLEKANEHYDDLERYNKYIDDNCPMSEDSKHILEQIKQKQESLDNVDTPIDSIDSIDTIDTFHESDEPDKPDQPDIGGEYSPKVEITEDNQDIQDIQDIDETETQENVQDNFDKEYNEETLQTDKNDEYDHDYNEYDNNQYDSSNVFEEGTEYVSNQKSNLMDGMVDGTENIQNIENTEDIAIDNSNVIQTNEINNNNINEIEQNDQIIGKDGEMENLIGGN